MNPFICVIPGDGCGREVTGESVKILDILQDRGSLEYDVFEAGAEHYEQTGKAWEELTIKRAREADAILFGAVGKPGVVKPDGSRPAGEVVFGLRNGLDLFANVRPIRLFHGIDHSISGQRKLVWKPEDVDLVIVRELTEGFYVRIGGELREGELAIDNRIITEIGSWRVIEFAANLALGREKHLTCVDKSNVLRGDRLFRRVFDDLVQHPGFSTLRTDAHYVDAVAMFLMTNPERFDVIVTPNLHGDILSDLASVLSGGIGMAPSGSYGYYNAMFEPIHGSAPDIAGKGIVNPSASLLSLAMLLEYLAAKSSGTISADFRIFSDALEQSVVKTIANNIKTPDLGGDTTTSEFGDRVKDTFLELTQI